MQDVNVTDSFSDATGITAMSNWLKDLLPPSLDKFSGIIVALVLIVLGYIVAKIAAALVSGAINRTGLGKKAKSTGGNIGRSLSKAVFWVLFLVFILLGLKESGFGGSELSFVDDMLTKIFTYVPLVIGAAVIMGIGTILARVVKEAISSTLEVAQVDNLAAKFGFAGAEDGTSNTSISRGIGGLAAAIVLLLAATSAAVTLKITAIADLLNSITEYVDNALGAALILAIAVFIGRWVSNLVRNTLPALGVDDSLGAIASLDGTSRPGFVPSKLIGTLVFAAILLVGLSASMDVMDIPQLTKVFDNLMSIGGKVVLGAIIIGVGLFIANFVSKIVTQTSGDFAGSIVKYATMIIVTFMGLRQMELGETIVDTAFTYLVGAGAVAFGIGGAIAFGLGGREWAAKKLNKWWK